ncbi:hypothetical protein K7432_014019 [Basidiobolus ranarum]|uniref:Uncharacterized protein n=1 Tax=Basidiobolus ranarum TaxID=34480 RepID=A0ABR2WI97_9FUNG
MSGWPPYCNDSSNEWWPGETCTITVEDQFWGCAECDINNKVMNTEIGSVTGNCGSGEEFKGRMLSN